MLCDVNTKKVNIGLFGLNANASNLGCAALSYSFIGLLTDELETREKDYEITFYDSDNANLTNVSMFNSEKIHFRIYRYSKKKIKELFYKLREEDMVFDFTAGDSFTDYYGLDRFVKRTFCKTLVIIARKPLVLGPQTYGPFESIISKVWARFIFNRASHIFARDVASQKRTEALLVRNTVDVVTDVAFSLKYDRQMYTKLVCNNKINVGLNFSGLLYSGGYTKDNQFGLTVNYKEYCKEIMEYFSSRQKQYNIWLIPHATSKDKDFPDNDLIPIDALLSKYRFAMAAPNFSTPIEAKSFISKMDIFTGARMHATIAAFSAGVITIPFSYSVKFEGLYNELDYPYCIHGKSDQTEEAIKKTIEYIENVDCLRNAQEKSLKIINDKMSHFKNDIKLIVSKLT